MSTDAITDRSDGIVLLSQAFQDMMMFVVLFECSRTAQNARFWHRESTSAKNNRTCYL